jgi:NTE family protein
MAAGREGRGGCETAVDRLEPAWNGLARTGVFGASLSGRTGTALRSGRHRYSIMPLRALVESSVPVRRIEDLEMPFQSVAVSIERAAEHWFTEGPLIEAVLASCAVGGLLPPAETGEGHFLGGGLVDSPVGRASPARSGIGAAYRVRAVPVRAGGRHQVAETEPRCPYRQRSCDGL